jgi:predicted phosphate transport protein (TIGR00153 family)
VRLIPRDEGFFTLFNQLAAKMKTSSELLQKMFSSPHELRRYVAEIKTVEHEADAVVHELATRLDRSFITPLDREDIYKLAQELDNVVDLIDGTARRAAMFDIREPRPAALRMADILREAVNELEESVRQVKERSSVAQHTRAIKKHEEAGDSAYAEAVGALFQGTPDPIDVIKWKEMYDTLEEALDRCQTASIVVESISIKHS